jgi:hypothetical protein
MTSMDQIYASPSYRLYRRLLAFYPKNHRDEYGPSMLQLFKDQYRSARQGGTPGCLAFLWLRTLKDLAVNLWKEHVTHPGASNGLLEPVPNSPLPWKGVVLVLIPGIVFMVGQIGQLAGEDWFYLLVRRAAYYLIVPVLLVWFVKRKFPIWGLIPLGMLYRTLFDVAYRVPSMLSENITRIFESPNSPIAKLYEKYPPVMKILNDTLFFLRAHSRDLQILVILVLLGSAAMMILLIIRRQGYPRAARAWTGIFILLILGQTLSGFLGLLIYNKWPLDMLIFSTDIWSVITVETGMAYDYFTLYFGFFLLILIGALLAQRHGRLALLLPLGYLIPTVVLGRFAYDENVPYLLVSVSVIVFVYRVLVSLIAPVWIVRSATEHAQKRAGTVALLTAIALLVAAHVGFLVIGIAAYKWELDALGFYYSLSPELITLAGIALAVSLYRREASTQSELVLNPVESKI